MIVWAAISLCPSGPSAAPRSGTASQLTLDTVRAELRAGRFSDAERDARDLAKNAAHLHGEQSLEAADALDLLAIALRKGGKAGTAEALEVCNRSLEIRTSRLPPLDPSLALSLENLGALHLTNGNLGEARGPLYRALGIRVAAHGPRHADVASSLLFLGYLEFSEARDDSARSLVERAIAIQDSTLAGDDPSRSQGLEMLAAIQYEQGEYREAGLAYERVLDLRIRALGLKHASTASTLHNLGSLYSEMGDFDEARRLLSRARQIIRDHLSPQHPMMARTLAALAKVNEDTGRRSPARPLYQEAIRILRKAYGNQHADVGWCLWRLGRLDLSLGRLIDARRELEEALRIQEASLPKEHPDLAWTLATLARADAARGAVPLALERASKALAIQTNALGEGHPDLAPTLADLGRFQSLAGDTTQAFENAMRAARIRTEHLRLTARGLSERQAIAYASTGPTGLDLALALTARRSGGGGREALRQTWEATLENRTLVLDEMTQRHQSTLATATAETVRAFQELTAARQRLAHLLVRGPGGDAPTRYQALLRSARLRAEQAERRLSATEGEPQASSPTRPALNDILEAVPSRWGLVAYTSFRTSLGRQYLAFVHSPGAEPALVSMGDAAAVDQHVIRWSRDLVSTPLEDGVQAKRVEAAARESGRAVRRLIWDPVVAALGDVEGVIIVPEGTINGVNFAALPGPGVEYLAERPMVFHYVTSELDIPARGSRKHGTGLLAFGGIDFGAPTRRAATRAAGDEDCQGFYASAFPQLPQSRLEVEEIAAAWPESSSLDVLTGARATESAFKRLAPGKRVLHLATHGFFLDPSHCQSTEAVDRRGIRVDLSVRIPKRKSLYQESPLLLSGLALAGANRRSEATPIGEDGVLTAEEVASLDLRGVDWAVLSACDTGIAGSAPGDGVLGLRRAFRTAGVATLIVSLWPVQDQAAREWMGKFYRNRNQSGVDTARAARAAMLEMLRNRRAHGRSTSPFYWAAFLAAGDWN